MSNAPSQATTDFDRPFQQLITEAAWGSVWSRPTWSKRERSMVTLGAACSTWP